MRTRRNRFLMPEWEVCTRFALWLAARQGIDRVTMSPPPGRKADPHHEKVEALLSERGWSACPQAARAFRASDGLATIEISGRAGVADVLGEGSAGRIAAECKGFNVKPRPDGSLPNPDAGTRSSLNECIGQAVASRVEASESYAVFPATDWYIEHVAAVARLNRIVRSGIRFALVRQDGEVIVVTRIHQSAP